MIQSRSIVDVPPEAASRPRGCVGVWTFIPIHGRQGIRGWTLIDCDDYECVSEHRWHFTGEGYVGRTDRSGDRPRDERLHRMLLGLRFGDPREGDHINRDRLDNRRGNLRIANDGQQMQNRAAFSSSSSSFRGVSFCNGRGAKPWKAQVGLGGKNRHLGYFATEQEAADVAAAFRAEHMPYATD